MDLINGIKYNIRGLAMGLKTPRLLLLGLIRFLVVIIITIGAASLILVYHQEILNFMWSKPQSSWILWLWYLVSWLLTAVLVGFSAVLSYLVSQILFSVLIMDLMSRITEASVTGKVRAPADIPLWQQFLFLVRQEIPRTTIPVLITLLLILVGWLTPLGPVVTIVSSAIAVIFLAWDNTDLIPARRLVPFGERFGVKYFLTSIGVLLLLIFKNVFLTKAKIYTHTLFSAVIIVFSAVIVWELFLIIVII